VKDYLIVTDDNFEREVLQSSIPVVVDFWASWCIPSQMMLPVIEKLSQEYDSKVKIRKLNVDQNPQTREKYKILGCPSFLFFKNGTEIMRKVGAQSERQLKTVIDSML
jgi:thioredoxin 1